MPGAVDHDTSVGYEWLVFNFSDLNLAALDHLWQGFKSVYIAGVWVDSDKNVRGLLGDWEDVALLVGDFRWVDLDLDVDRGLTVLEEGFVIRTVEVVIFAFEDFREVIATVGVVGLEHG